MLDQKYTGIIRHGIEYYGTKPTIPAALRRYRGFLQNDQRARISFVTAPGTGFKNLKGVYSTDPDIQTFNKIFSQANPNINWKLVKTYDFVDNVNPPPSQNTNPVLPPAPRPPIVGPVNPPSNLIPTGQKDNDIIIGEESSPIVPILLIGIAALVILKSKKGKRKKR